MDASAAARHDRRLPLISPQSHYLYNEKEARVMGASANRIVNLRAYRDYGTGGSLMVKDHRNGISSLSLSDNEMFAVLSLLIQREATILASFNVEVEDYDNSPST